MTDINSMLLLVVILLNFFILGSARLVACIRAVALQGALLALMPVTVHGLSIHSLGLAGGAFLFKGVLIPWLMLRAIREVRIRREVEPLISLVATLFLGAMATVAAFLFADQLPLIHESQAGVLVPASLATMLAGFLLLMTRRKAITQVVGYLMLENGIFIFGVLLSTAMPLVVEAAILLDLLVAVFVMGIVLNHINREFSSINVERLSALKE